MRRRRPRRVVVRPRWVRRGRCLSRTGRPRLSRRTPTPGSRPFGRGPGAGPSCSTRDWRWSPVPGGVPSPRNRRSSPDTPPTTGSVRNVTSAMWPGRHARQLMPWGVAGLPLAAPRASPHWLQNLAPSAFIAPQAGQAQGQRSRGDCSGRSSRRDQGLAARRQSLAPRALVALQPGQTGPPGTSGSERLYSDSFGALTGRILRRMLAGPAGAFRAHRHGRTLGKETEQARAPYHARGERLSKGLGPGVLHWQRPARRAVASTEQRPSPIGRPEPAGTVHRARGRRRAWAADERTRPPPSTLATRLSSPRLAAALACEAPPKPCGGPHKGMPFRLDTIHRNWLKKRSPTWSSCPSDDTRYHWRVPVARFSDEVDELMSPSA